MKPRFHPKAIERVIDDLFSEQMERSQTTKADKLLPTVIGIKGVEYVFRHIDTRDSEKLNELANKKLKKFIDEHLDNTKELFIEIETERAKEYQSYFPEYKINKEQKEYYYKLQRWIDYLNEISESKGTEEDSSDKPPVKSYSLLHVYWSKYDETKKITDTNKLKLSTDYNFSQNTLKKWFDLYIERDERKPASHDVRAITPFIRALSGAIKMLESLCPEGFQDAEKELKAIKHKYLPKED